MPQILATILCNRAKRLCITRFGKFAVFNGKGTFYKVDR
ncbi:hypothetical protein ACVWWG_003996 [Bradyrhizobium sp. LB7.2]